MLNRGIIDLQEGQRLGIKDVHWGGVAIEYEAILFFTLAQAFLGALPVGDIPRVYHYGRDFRINLAILPNRFQVAPGAITMLDSKLKGHGSVRLLKTIIKPSQNPRQI